MSITKTVTEKVIEANRANGKKGGPKTNRGKDRVSQNAIKHGILARKFPFSSDHEKAAYKRLFSDLRRSIDRHNPLQRMLAEEVAMACVRRARALRLEQKLCQRRNPATELALDAVEKSDLVETGLLFVDDASGWECTELTVTGKKADERLQRNGAVANSSGGNQHLQLHAKFQDPMDKALRYQRVTARDFYKALECLSRLRKKQKSSKHSRHHPR